jgi:NADP-dependent 3-hydroxy acid dehydrogenase YdfG
MSLTDTSHRIAIVTGAGSGIGKATALQFAEAGINLALIGRSADKLAAVATAATALGVKATTYTLDLAQVDRTAERLSDIATELGRVDILVNNAGMAYTNPIGSTPLADWQRIIDLNLTSVFQCIQGLLPTMRRQKSGTIVNLSSICGKQVFPNWGAYSVSKFGLMALTQAVAAEERANGIRSVAICPGAVNTPLWDTDTVDADFDRAVMLTPEIVARSILHLVETPPGATIEELTLMPSAGAL